MGASGSHVNAYDVRALAAAGKWTPSQARAVETLLRQRLPWRRWSERILLVLGAGLLLTGIVFFFAYNWKAITPLQKFATIEVGLGLCVVGAWWIGLDRPLGKTLAGAACMLTGVFLAVAGQVYQTGADAWELFAGWAVLVLPWILVVQTEALWAAWLILLNLGAWFWWGTSPFAQRLSAADTLAAFGFLNALALVAREAAAAAGFRGLRANWLHAYLVTVVCGWLTIAGCASVLSDTLREAGVAIPAVLIALGTGYWWFRLRSPDLFSLSAGALAACVIVVTGIGRALFQGAREPVLVFFVMPIIVLVIFGAAMKWLQSVARALKQPEEVTP